MRDRYSINAITNDIYTREEAEFLTRSGALPPERIEGEGVDEVADFIDRSGGLAGN